MRAVSTRIGILRLRRVRVVLYPVAVSIAWGAAAAFAASLGYLVYFYVVRLGNVGDATADWPGAITIDVALFTAFALHHSLLARTRAKTIITRVIPPHLERATYVWVASGLAVLMCVLWQPIGGVIYRIDGPARFLTWAVQAAGLLLTVNTARVLSVRDLAGIDQAARRRPIAGLKIVGPFNIVRHPIYLGWMLMVFGTSTMTTDRLVFAAVSSAYLILAIPWEEKSLVAGHGGQYRDYQRRVRWRLVPGIW